MATVIKASDVGNAVRAAAFHFDDLARRGEAYLQQARQQASEIIRQTGQDAIAIRKQAHEQGLRDAEATVQARLERLLADKLATLRPAILQATAEIEQSKQAWLAYWEKRAVHLAAAMAARVIRRELKAQPDLPLGLIREALELAAGSTQIRIRINPADHAALGPSIQSIVTGLSGLGETELLPDAAVSQGGCRVETRFGAIDQQVEAQLARIEEELT